MFTMNSTFWLFSNLLAVTFVLLVCWLVLKVILRSVGVIELSKRKFIHSERLWGCWMAALRRTALIKHVRSNSTLDQLQSTHRKHVYSERC